MMWDTEPERCKCGKFPDFYTVAHSDKFQGVIVCPDCHAEVQSRWDYSEEDSMTEAIEEWDELMKGEDHDERSKV